MILSSLEIKNFRLLKHLSVEKVGRVNLIVGKNNSGKSSVLEALRIYANNARASILREIAESHDERSDIAGVDRVVPHGPTRFEHFFTGRRFPSNEEDGIVIGEVASPQALKIQHVFFEQIEQTILDEDGDSQFRVRKKKISKSVAAKSVDRVVLQALQVSGKTRTFNIYLQPTRNAGLSPGFLAARTPCSYVPTRFISLDRLADQWDEIALTPEEEIAKDALRIIAPELEDLAFIKRAATPGDDSGVDRNLRTAYVKLVGVDQVVPLNSMGDGMARVLQLALSVFSAKDGLLLIDEFENGLHYSVQEKVWALIFHLAQTLNIQVFATTHSWDCIESFAKVAIDRKDVDGVLFRVGKSVRKSAKGNIVATVFDEEKLFNLTQADVEVR